MILLNRLALAGAVALAFLCGVEAKADSPDFSGHWQVNPDKSHFGNERTLSLDIQQHGDDVTFVRTYQKKNGKEVSARFTCTVGGKECTFNNDGHAAKVLLWYLGPSLVILKTEGEKSDSTVEWHLKLAADGKSLTIDREIMEPVDKTEKLSLDKVASVAMR